MKFEKPKKETSIESDILEIKKAEAEKEVEVAAEEFETKAIAEAIDNEIPAGEEGEDELEKASKTETLVKEMELNPEAKERREVINKIAEYAREVYKIGRDYETVYSNFVPLGADGKRSFNDEIDLYLNTRGKREEYQPSFTYPEMKKQNVNKLQSKIAEIEDIEKKAENEKNEHIKNIVHEMCSVIKAKIGILVEILNGDPKSAFENAKIAYGDIDEELCKSAEDYHKAKINYLKDKKDKGVVKSEIEKLLEDNEFDADDIKAYLDFALDEGGLRYGGIEVIISENDKSVDVRPSDQNYDHPVIIVPGDKKLTGMKLMRLIAHEIGCHVVQNKYNYELGLEGASFGKDWEALQEGFAVRNAIKIENDIIGKEQSGFEIMTNDYYILAMDKIKQGYNIGEVYDYIYNLEKEEFIADGKDEEKSNKEADKEAKKVLQRVFRGMYPFYFPKDLAYFKGQVMAKKVEEEGVKQYALQSRVDPALIPELIDAGIFMKSYTYEKGLMLSTKIAQKIWEDQGWPVEYLLNKKYFAKDFTKNIKYYKGNMQMDRYFAYMKEFKDKYEND